MMSEGFAVIDADGINVATVSNTERGAKVNWLGITGAAFVTKAWDDRRIADAFERYRGTARVARVSITETVAS
jgi:hypothetical protein